MNSKEEKFTQIVREYRDKIYRLCWSYMDNEDDRKDLQQIILVKVWQNLDRFEGKSSPSTWLYRLAVNASIDYARKNNRYRRYFSNAEVADMGAIDPACDSEENYIRSEALQLLHTYINRLSFVDKTLVLLYLEDLSYKEIAQIVGITEKNVSVKLVRIKKSMRRYAEDYEL